MTPSDAGAIVLLRPSAAGRDDPEVYWAERAASASFLGGYHAFIGGKVEPGDEQVPLAGAGDGGGDRERVAMVAALRELFEETGVLVAEWASPPPPGNRAAARRDLNQGKSFAGVLATLGARLDAASLRPAGRWVTPEFAPRRFDTFFYLAWLPAGQEPELSSAELARGEWIRPAAAVAAWEASRVLLAPPVLHLARALAAGPGEGLEARLLGRPEAAGGRIERIEFLPGIVLVPIRTKTLPSARHTNAYIVGRDEAVIIDPPSPEADEQARLDRVIDELVGEGVRPREVLLTHHHFDHVEGADAVRDRYRLPVAAHPLTAARLEGKVRVDRLVAEGDRIELGKGYALTALHTPGHAPGHLCFQEEKTRALITGDNVVGTGTVLIDPDEGDMGAYLDSLRRLLELEPRALFGGHGPAVADAGPRIRALIAHRLWREAEIVRALEDGAATAAEVVDRAYKETAPAVRELALRQARAHLDWLARKGRVRLDGERWHALRA